MKERDLLKQLNNLRNIRPDDAWKQSQRDLLLTQISNSAPKEISSWEGFVIVFKTSVKTFSQPAVAFASLVCLMFVSAVFSHSWLSNAKPNGTMYVARVISEKVKLNTVIDKEAREKMEAQFATEHATDIAAVLADPKFNIPANQTEVAKLSNDFNKEIETVNVRLTAMAPVATITPAKIDEKVISASSGKDDRGMQLFIPAKATSTTPTSTATSTKEKTIIDQAQDSFKKKDYQKTLDNLQKIDELIK
ncbi:MAG: hypothetical protein ACOYMB_02250 [Patescibacteria group bacterium]